MSSTIFECSICYSIYNESISLALKLNSLYRHEQATHHIMWSHLLWVVFTSMHYKSHCSKGFIWVYWRWADWRLQSRLAHWYVSVQMPYLLENSSDSSKQTCMRLLNPFSLTLDNCLVADWSSYYRWKLILQIEQPKLTALTLKEHFLEHDKLCKLTVTCGNCL